MEGLNVNASSGLEKTRVWPVSLAHGLNDSCGAFLSALLPLIIEKLEISLERSLDF